MISRRGFVQVAGVAIGATLLPPMVFYFLEDTPQLEINAMDFILIDDYADYDPENIFVHDYAIVSLDGMGLIEPTVTPTATVVPEVTATHAPRRTPKPTKTPRPRP